ncbi:MULTISPECIES: signal peptidase I [unclassified Thermoactinomyces]|jgi:signal peptidase I|uniref:signal peptidase I n=1 Tax=unclassified Thermoactinomyces TaxID=2634588 RepID=UPI0018DCAFB0|nr:MULTISPECIES: signal peptidase I [unclassified Thermoactinomyces]MBH8596813.1 signal peptidase I [Thermoactinomyces sp. CICC 10523]MBH8603573.1 signal peptidase I [Thermoactinomyces sp. CICC 10522]MBH8606738.1 signal peptidase I [Thermoactinomyces sp. CICC 10521]
MRLLKEGVAWFSSLFTGMAIALIISIFILQPTKVLGHSMEPTLMPDHHIFVSKLPCVLQYHPHHGDIVIIDSRIHHQRTWVDDLMDSPLYVWITGTSPHNIWVKRVIGVPRDVIEIKNNRVYRNNQLLKESYIKEEMNNTPDMKITVPDNCIFVMGDNRNYSMDSREIGCVPIDHVLGVKIF